MRLPRLLSGGAVVAVLAGTAACGLQTVEPKLELRDAANAFTSARSVSLRLSLPSPAADVRAFTTQAAAESPADDSGDVSGVGGDAGSGPGVTASTGTADPTSAVGGILGDRVPSSATITATTSSEPISDADLEQLLSSHLDVAYDKGADAAKTSDDAARVLVHIGGSDAGEVRTVGQVVYARVDLAGIEKEFPDAKQDIEDGRTQLTGGEGADAVPEALRVPVQAVYDGKWVSVDGRDGSYLDQQLKDAARKGTGPAGGLAPDAPAKLQALAGKAFGNGVVTVKRVDGDGTLGDHLVATANLRAVYTNIRADLPGLVTGDAATSLQKDLPAVEKVPDRDLAVSFWVKGGTFSRVELDLAQFLDKPAGHMVLRADALPQQPVNAPSGAVAVDLKAIADAAGGSLSDLFRGNGGGRPVDAQTAASWVDQDIREMADGDGVAPSASYLPRVTQDFTDITPPVTLRKVGRKIQVTVDGKSACLTLPATTDEDGRVTAGHC